MYLLCECVRDRFPRALLGAWGCSVFFFLFFFKCASHWCKCERGIENRCSSEDLRHCVPAFVRVCSFLCVSVHGIAACPFRILYIHQCRQPTPHGPLCAPIPIIFVSPARSRRWKRACHAKAQREALLGVKVMITCPLQPVPGDDSSVQAARGADAIFAT